MNVLEPLLNIFSWADLLPHDNEERDIPLPEDEDDNQPEQARRSFWDWLFHRR